MMDPLVQLQEKEREIELLRQENAALLEAVSCCGQLGLSCSNSLDGESQLLAAADEG